MPVSSRRPLVAGNWKMNGLRSSIAELNAMVSGADAELAAAVDLLVCPPATILSLFAATAHGSAIAIGAQDCHPEAKGAHTGDLSAEMLADAGATAVIVGHSERRIDHGEQDATVRAKAEAVIRARMIAIVCVGENRGEREEGRAVEVVSQQIAGSIPIGLDPSRLVIAYEPVWAIGTGLTPTVQDVAAMHAEIRGRLRWRIGAAAEGVRILYGGSVKPQNAAELLAPPDVDGALVGGASLVAADFLAIARACAALVAA